MKRKGRRATATTTKEMNTAIVLSLFHFLFVCCANYGNWKFVHIIENFITNFEARLI